MGERALRDRTAPTVYVAAVNRGGEAPALIVRVDMATNRVFVRPVGARGEAGKSLELWYIGDGRTPVSMGLVGARSERLALPEGARPEKAKFAVTVEPEGGSPTGGPTGGPSRRRARQGIAKAARSRGPPSRTRAVGQGIRTLLMTWMTPFDCMTSAIVTRARTSPLVLDHQGRTLARDRQGLPFHGLEAGRTAAVLHRFRQVGAGRSG